MLSENPNMSMMPNVPMRDMGTAIMGMTVARQFCSDRNTTMMTMMSASKNVRYTWCMESDIYSVMSKGMT